MIVVDTSALVAILCDEPEAVRCRDVLENAELCVISAGTFQELLVVSAGRGLEEPARRLVAGMRMVVVDVTEELAELGSRCYRRWGKGAHPARLNFGDCFAYAVAEKWDLPLLYVGDDFARTDIRSALDPAP